MRMVVFRLQRNLWTVGHDAKQMSILGRTIRTDSKLLGLTGRKAVHLSPPAVALLQAIPRLEGNPYVICGEKAGQHLVNLEKPWRRIRKAAKLDDVRLHDLRHSFATRKATNRKLEANVERVPLPCISARPR
jgi:integrase